MVPQSTRLIGLDVGSHFVEDLLSPIGFAWVGLEDGYDFDFAGHLGWIFLDAL